MKDFKNAMKIVGIIIIIYALYVTGILPTLVGLIIVVLGFILQVIVAIAQFITSIVA